MITDNNKLAQRKVDNLWDIYNTKDIDYELNMFMDNIVSYNILYNSDGSYAGVEICDCTGGPSIWINTTSSTVSYYTNGEGHGYAFLPYDLVKMLDKYFERWS